ncbi:unnamed protein product [Rotaria socialis]|uniref:Uncharacterized protein n=1 Tax=Rotaria socialis TaxID=392032 RepID=A0A821QFI7_9BILA|nr:unnamed protein product [Rotaria socialis]
MDNAEISEDIHFRYLILHALIEAGVVGEPIRGSPTWRGLKAALDNHYSMAQDGPSSCMECMKNKPSKLATMKKPSQSLIGFSYQYIYILFPPPIWPINLLNLCYESARKCIHLSVVSLYCSDKVVRTPNYYKMFRNIFIIITCFYTIKYCCGWCHVIKSDDDSIGMLAKSTYQLSNNIWLKPEASFKSINISMFSRSFIITRGNFTALKWNVITTNVLYSFTTNVCAISATINDEKQFVIVTRCASGIGLMHQDSVMTVRVSGGSEISLSCDPEAYESDPDQKQRDDVTTEKSVETHPEESVETHPEESFEGGSDHIITPQPNVAGLTIFALIMICMIIAAVYLKVRLSRLERAMAGRIEPPSVSLNTTARAVENRYNEDLSVNCDA